MSSVLHTGSDKKQSSGLDVSDKNLVDLYVKGDVKALDELINRYKKPLYSFLWRLTSSGPEVDEIFQETWFRVIQKASSFDQYRFKGWIFRIAYNLVIDWSRSKRGHLSLDQTSEYSDGLETLSDTLPAPGQTPDEKAASGDIKQAILQALDHLPLEQKEVFLLRMEADMSFKDIAELQGTSINTALARMQYALTKMRKLLKTFHEDFERAL